MLDSPAIRKAILHNLISNEDYARQVIPHLKSDYFVEASERIIFDETVKYFHEYHALPTQGVLQIQVEQRNDLNESSFEEIRQFIHADIIPFGKPEFLIAKTEEWCRARAITLAVYKAVSVIGGEDKETTETALPKLLQDAIGVSFDKSVGHDWAENAEERFEFYKSKEARIATHLKWLDAVTGGGLPVKTLTIFMAGTNVGKSLAMCALTANIIARGGNVLYITMEMAEERIAQRIDQNLLDMTKDEIEAAARETLTDRFKQVSQRTHGRLVVKEYPTGNAHSGHFRALLDELRDKKGFKPDLICIDYLNICGAAGATKNTSDHNKVKMIAEECRAIAVDYVVPVISATQFNREGMKAGKEADITHTSESMGLPVTADFMFAISTNEVAHANGFLNFQQLKNRYGDARIARYQCIGVDYPKMRLYDLAQQPVQNDALNEAAVTPVTKAKGFDDMDGVSW